MNVQEAIAKSSAGMAYRTSRDNLVTLVTKDGSVFKERNTDFDKLTNVGKSRSFPDFKPVSGFESFISKWKRPTEMPKPKLSELLKQANHLIETIRSESETITDLTDEKGVRDRISKITEACDKLLKMY